MTLKTKLERYIKNRRQTLENALKIDIEIGADTSDNWRRLKELSMVSRVLNGKPTGDPDVYKITWE